MASLGAVDTSSDVTAAAPTLILSGGLDAQTPTIRSDIDSRSLPNAQTMAFPDGAHVQLTAANECAARAILACVLERKRKLDAECVDGQRFSPLAPYGIASASRKDETGRG